VQIQKARLSARVGVSVWVRGAYGAEANTPKVSRFETPLVLSGDAKGIKRVRNGRGFPLPTNLGFGGAS